MADRSASVVQTSSLKRPGPMAYSNSTSVSSVAGWSVGA
jgi:hypothetical protein